MSGDGMENAHSAALHTISRCSRIGITLSIVARPRVCLSTLLWSFSNIGWDKAVKTAEVIAATLQPSSPRKTSLRGSVAGTAGDSISPVFTENAPTWLKAPTNAFTFKTLLRHYAKQALTPR